MPKFRRLAHDEPIVLSNGRTIQESGLHQLALFAGEQRAFLRARLRQGKITNRNFLGLHITLGTFLRWLGDKRLNISPWNITAEQLLSWLGTYQRERGLSNHSISHLVAIFRKFYRFHRTQRVCALDPAELFANYSGPKRRALLLTSGKFQTAISKLVSVNNTCCDSLAILLSLGVNTAARPEELLGLKFRSLVFKRDVCEITLQSKSVPKRIVYVNRSLARILKSLSKHMSPDDYVFSPVINFYAAVGYPLLASYAARCLKLLLGKDFKLRTLRRLYATLYARRKGDPLLLMRIFGHSNLYSTDTYVHDLDFQSIRKYGKFIERLVEQN